MEEQKEKSYQQLTRNSRSIMTKLAAGPELELVVSYPAVCQGPAPLAQAIGVLIIRRINRSAYTFATGSDLLISRRGFETAVRVTKRGRNLLSCEALPRKKITRDR